MSYLLIIIQKLFQLFLIDDLNNFIYFNSIVFLVLLWNICKYWSVIYYSNYIGFTLIAVRLYYQILLQNANCYRRTLQYFNLYLLTYESLALHDDLVHHYIRCTGSSAVYLD